MSTFGANISSYMTRIVNALGLVTSSQAADRSARAYREGVRDLEDEPVSGTIKQWGYRRITSKHLRDFSEASREDILKTAWSLWQSSPLAKRIMVLKRDHIIGGGVKPKAEDMDLQTALDAFWKDNKLDRRSKEFTLQLFLFGEQCLPAFVRESDGRSRLGYLDPSMIAEVITHPNNAMEMWAVVTKEEAADRSWVSGGRARIFRIVREDESFTTVNEEGPLVIQANHEGLLVTADQATLQDWERAFLADYDRDAYDGSCFYSKVNSVSNQPRGYSDLMQPSDWIDHIDATLFSLLDREQMAGFFSWDVTMDGAKPEEVEARARELAPDLPTRGAAKVHSDTEHWEFIYPDLKQPGSIESFRAALGFVLGGVGFPVHWFGFGDDANRATAAVQGDPTEKSLEHDQGIVKELFIDILTFTRDQAIIAGTLPESSMEEVPELSMPEITRRDLSSLAPLFAPFAAALINSVDSGLLTRETAVKLWTRVLGELGVDIDTAAELKELEDFDEPDDLGLMGALNAFSQSKMDAAGIPGNGQPPPNGAEEVEEG